MSIIIPANSAVGGGFDVDNSVRFNGGSSDDLTGTPSGTPTSRYKGTLSVWLKRSAIDEEDFIFYGLEGSANRMKITFKSDNKLQINTIQAGSNNLVYETNRLFRDVSAWYHIVIAIDTTLGTAGDRCRLYVNGVEETSFSTETDFSQNAITFMSETNIPVYIGSQSTDNYYDGYMAEYVLIDGQQLAPTSFGEFDEDSGIWKPIDVSGLTFGTNGFYLDFENSGSLGADVSGNSNNFTARNLTAIDQSTDTCTNNAVTFMSNHPSADAFVLSQGGLQISKSGTGQVGLYGSSIMLSEGKWYWEVKFTAVSGSDRTRAGVAAYESVTGTSTIQADYSGFEFTSSTSGRFSITEAGSTTEVDGFNGFSEGDIIRFALDMDNTKLYVGRNGDWFNYSSSATGGNPASGSGYVTNSAVALAAPVTIYAGNSRPATGSAMELQFNFGATNTFSVSSGNQDANGYGNFEYAVPSGYFSLNTKNLAEYG